MKKKKYITEQQTKGAALLIVVFFLTLVSIVTVLGFTTSLIRELQRVKDFVAVPFGFSDSMNFKNAKLLRCLRLKCAESINQFPDMTLFCEENIRYL